MIASIVIKISTSCRHFLTVRFKKEDIAVNTEHDSEWFIFWLTYRNYTRNKIVDPVLNATEQHIQTSHHGVFSFTISRFVLETFKPSFHFVVIVVAKSFSTM